LDGIKLVLKSPSDIKRVVVKALGQNSILPVKRKEYNNLNVFSNPNFDYLSEFNKANGAVIKFRVAVQMKR